MDSMLFCLFTIELYLDDVEWRKESVRQNMELKSWGKSVITHEAEGHGDAGKFTEVYDQWLEVGIYFMVYEKNITLLKPIGRLLLSLTGEKQFHERIPFLFFARHIGYHHPG